MSHTVAKKKRLVQRVRRIRGQGEAIERAPVEEQDGAAILHTIVATRGAINALMVEVVEGHIRQHVLDATRRQSPEKVRVAEEVSEVVRTYLK